MDRCSLTLVMLLAGCGLSACASYSHTNKPLPPSAAASAAAPTPTRATFSVGGERGNPRVLMFLALSGGGSHAACVRRRQLRQPGAEVD